MCSILLFIYIFKYLAYRQGIAWAVEYNINSITLLGFFNGSI